MPEPTAPSSFIAFQIGIPNPSGFNLEHWVFWALLSGLAFLVISIQTNRHRLTVFFKSMVHRPLLLEYVDDFNQKGMPADWSLFLAGFAVAPVLFAYAGMAATPWTTLAATLGLMGGVLLKTLLVENLGRLFAFKPLARTHNAVFFQFLFGLGILFLLAVFLYTLGWIPVPEPQPYALLFFFLIGYLLYFIRLASVLWFSTHAIGVYYILYLCTLELIPLGVFLRWSGVFL
ncbi:MAG: DUF4271 domain-containing protein [Bacteroidia bacterium]|jgi:hypothetical protein